MAGMQHYNKSEYSTSLIGNYSLAWIRKVAKDTSTPVLTHHHHHHHHFG